MDRPWIFRCDGGARLGLGHIHRCLALMEALSELGASAVLATLFPHEVPKDAGLAGKTHTLRAAGRGTGAALELAELAGALNARGIVFDHYDVDRELFRRIRAAAPGDLRLIAIGNRLPLAEELDLVIRQRLRPTDEPSERELAGAEYLLMRKAFRNRPRRETAPVVRRLLVTLGGSDSPYLRTVLKALSRPLGPEPVEIWVAGRSAPSDGLEGSAGQTAFLGLVDDMAGLLESVDLAVTACGTTLYQMAACGLPAIGIAIADNQLQQAADFAEAGLIHYLGPAESLTEEALHQAALELMQDSDRRRRMAARGQERIDGLGAVRCAEALLKL